MRQLQVRQVQPLRVQKERGKGIEMLSQIRANVWINPSQVVAVIFNPEKLQTDIVLVNGMVIQSEKTFDETIKVINEA